MRFIEKFMHELSICVFPLGSPVQSNSTNQNTRMLFVKISVKITQSFVLGIVTCTRSRLAATLAAPKFYKIEILLTSAHFYLKEYLAQHLPMRKVKERRMNPKLGPILIEMNSIWEHFQTKSINRGPNFEVLIQLFF